jgi:hypothetical protein
MSRRWTSFEKCTIAIGVASLIVILVALVISRDFRERIGIENSATPASTTGAATSNGDGSIANSGNGNKITVTAPPDKKAPREKE